MASLRGRYGLLEVALGAGLVVVGLMVGVAWAVAKSVPFALVVLAGVLAGVCVALATIRTTADASQRSATEHGGSTAPERREPPSTKLTVGSTDDHQLPLGVVIGIFYVFVVGLGGGIALAAVGTNHVVQEELAGVLLLMGAIAGGWLLVA
jgi:hypothetical protein